MGAPSAGQVILIPFPFSDLSATKVRPAVCLADAGKGDWVLCQVTSRAYADPGALELTDADFASGGLRLVSYARPGKLFTAHESLFVSTAGELNSHALSRILRAIVTLFQAGDPGQAHSASS